MMKLQRGFSIAEILTVVVIIGMLLTTMVVIVPEMGKAPMQAQAQVDQVNTAAIALYRIHRDFSAADSAGVMQCTTAPTVSCAPPGSGLSPVQALTVPTAENSSGALQVDSQGYPWWQGYYVYWLAPDPSGVAMDLMRAYESAPGIYSPTNNGVPLANAGLATTALTNALTITPAPVLTNYIETMKLGTVGTSNTINFQLTAGTTSGADQTQTVFPSNTYARN